ncbi:MAG TPA: complex I NDUFA9 subunit family protein [Roseiarcus sp.]|nr:complex I NDUFA9 subunit family protein [Roseiarcus sp.]
MADFPYVSHRPFPADRLAVVFGGSGFIGRHVVRGLVKRGWRVRVAVRRPDLANFLQPIGVVGQINAVQANLRFPASIDAALVGADAAINLVGVKKQRGAQRFDAVHVEGAAALAHAAAARGLPFVHMSGIGADAGSPSPYIASKGRGEQAVRAAEPAAIVLRPSIVFGPEDDFFNRFGLLACYSPALPLFGGGRTKLQPVYVGDVAEAAARALEDEGARGRTYELGGPEIMTFRQVVEFVCRTAERRRIFVNTPFPLAAGLAAVTEFADRISFGFFPKALTMTRDDIALLRTDNVVSPEAIAAGLTLAGLGIEPEAVEAIAPAYLYRFRRSGQYADSRFA